MQERKFKVEAWCDQLPVQCFIALCSTGCVLWQWCMESNTHYMHSSPYYKFNLKLNPAESFGWNPLFENGLNMNLSYSVFLLESTVLLQFFLTNLFTLPSIALLAEQLKGEKKPEQAIFSIIWLIPSSIGATWTRFLHIKRLFFEFNPFSILDEQE